jgi:hypothetical protein
MNVEQITMTLSEEMVLKAVQYWMNRRLMRQPTRLLDMRKKYQSDTEYQITIERASATPEPKRIECKECCLTFTEGDSTGCTSPGCPMPATV